MIMHGQAVAQYADEVQSKEFPDDERTYKKK